MKLAAITALQLLETFSHFTDSATLPPQHLASRDQTRETRQEFDDTTTTLKQQGLCRLYHDSADKRGNELGTCEPKCGDLVKKGVGAGNGDSLSCTAGGDNIPEHTDPDGDTYHSGQCVCDVPTSDQLVDGVHLTLPIVTDIGCPILYSAFDAILDAGEAAIPEEGASMDVGMEAAIQAAKTVSSSGGKASSFSDWFDHSCGVNKYANAIDQIFGPLSNVSNVIVPSTDTESTDGKEKRSPKGGRGGGGAGGKSSASSGGGGGGSKGGSGPLSGSKPNVPTPKGKSPPKKDGKKVQNTKAAKKPSPTTAKVAERPTQATKTEKKKQSPSKGSGKGTVQATKPTKQVASKVQQTSSGSQGTSVIKVTSSISTNSLPGESQASRSTALPKSPQPSTSSNGPGVATDELQDVPSATPATSLSDSVFPGSEQLVATSAELSQSLELDPIATPALEEDLTATSSETLNDDSTATDGSSNAETDGSLSVITPSPLPTATGIKSSWGTDRTSLPSTLEVSTLTKPGSPVPSKAIIDCPAKAVTDTSTVDEQRLVKRADVGGGAEIRMTMPQRLGGTYMGFAPFNYNLDCWELREYAIQGYRQISTQPGITDGTIIVAALWIPEVGVVVGSKPRGGVGSTRQREDAIARQLRDMAQGWFPAYWDLVSSRYHRDRSGELDKWHAEDVALIYGGYEWTQAMAFRDPHRSPPLLRHFGFYAESLAYGKYNRHDQVGFKPACGQGNVNDARMQPPCADVLADLGVAWIRSSSAPM